MVLISKTVNRALIAEKLALLEMKGFRPTAEISPDKMTTNRTIMTGTFIVKYFLF